MKKILIFGATSAIAEQVARAFASQGAALFLVGRREDRLQTLKNDLMTRGAGQVLIKIMDALDYDQQRALIDEILDTDAGLGGLDQALVAHGNLPDQQTCQGDVSIMREAMDTNFLSAVNILELCAGVLEKQGHGTLAVISSVAGDRGRQSNYVYGAAKAGLSAYASGLRNRLYEKGIRVITIKPGFVDTPMTAKFPKGPLWASAEQVGLAIHQIMNRPSLLGGDVVYLPGFWRLIMLIIRSIPETLFKRLSL